MAMNLYQFNFNKINGEEISFKSFKGKVVLIVNTASNCGLTYHYKGLESPYQEYKDDGLEVIGFPCNQFGKQEPGTAKEIENFCNDKYGITFTLSEKIEVNGSNAHPVYKYLKSELKGKLNDSIKWNFTKFLIDRNGVPFKRFSSTAEPENIKPFIEELI